MESFTVLDGIVAAVIILSAVLAYSRGFVREALSIAGWIVFGALLWGRWRYGWRGHRAIQLTLAAVALLALAYFGSKFVLEVILDRV